MTHLVEQDWRAAQRALADTKARAIGETLEHLADLETMFENDGGKWTDTCTDMRNLSARLRSAQRDFDHEAGTAGG